MLCLKKTPRHTIYYSVLFLAVFFSCFFGLFSGSCSALSSSSYTFDENNAARYMASTDMFPNLGFSINYVRIKYDAPANTKMNFMLLALINRSQSTSYFYAVPDSNGFFDVMTSVPTGVFYFQSLSGLPSTYTFTITVYDDFPSGGSSEPCPDCPEIPDDSQTLLDIKHAIILIPAMMFVIYLFYILYSWYCGGKL